MGKNCKKMEEKAVGIVPFLILPLELPKHVAAPTSAKTLIANAARFKNSGGVIQRVAGAINDKKPMDKQFWKDWLAWRRDSSPG